VRVKGKSVLQSGNIQTSWQVRRGIHYYFDTFEVDTRTQSTLSISLHFRFPDNCSHYVRHSPLRFERFKILLECLPNPRSVFHSSYVGVWCCRKDVSQVRFWLNRNNIKKIVTKSIVVKEVCYIHLVRLALVSHFLISSRKFTIA